MNNLQTKINHLLVKTGEISRRFEEVEKTTGAGFNLLNLLNMGHYEAKTHTPILAELLNPKGSHSQGAVFLELFLETCVRRSSTFMQNAEAVTVQQEKYLGRVDFETETGGIIDIYFESITHQLLLIENKINSDEGPIQIKRYLNHVRDMPEESAQVIYLTLFGAEPQSLKKQPQNLKCISYRSDILAWLRLCRKEVATVPILRESLTIYINLICQLTNQSPNQKMNSEISNAIVNSPDFLEAYGNIPSLNDIQRATFAKLEESLGKIADKHSLRLKISELPITALHFGFGFNLASSREIQIRFEFQRSNCRHLIWGIFEEIELPQQDRLRLQSLVKREIGRVKQARWPAFKPWEKYLNWSGDTLVSVAHGSFVEDLDEKVAILAKISEEFSVSNR